MSRGNVLTAETQETKSDHCNNCGLCCMHMRTPPFVGIGDDPDWDQLPDELKSEIEAWLDSPRFTQAEESFGDKLPCIWLDLATGKCRHYEWRPEVCRSFEVGGHSCREWRIEVGLTVEGLPVTAEPPEVA